MQVTLDGQIVFDDERVETLAGSLRREQIERSVGGLDGAVSIDLGLRGRKIKQSGLLRAVSKKGLDEKIAAVEAFIDGSSHTLVSEDGTVFGDVRMDSFVAKKISSGGGSICCEYEVVYTQLKGG